MNQTHGPEAARTIRETGFSDVIVGVTGNVNDDDVYEYLSAGANIILAKPPRMQDLDVVFQEVFEKRAQALAQSRLSFDLTEEATLTEVATQAPEEVFR